MKLELYVDQGAEEAHQEVVALSKRHKFDDARIQATNAQITMETVYPDGPSRELHLARLQRDIAFIAVREAVVNEEPNLGDAEARLDDSLRDTNLLVDGFSDMRDQESVETVSSEHGATLTVLGRLMVVKSVFLEPGSPNEKRQLREANDNFILSAMNLDIGNNDYYQVSNAMHAARAETIAGNHDSASRWQKTAFELVKEAYKTDKIGSIPSGLTYFNYRRDLLGANVARKAVFKRP